MESVSRNWDQCTSTEILADVNAALNALYKAQEPRPEFMVISVPAFWSMLRYPVLAGLCRCRGRRPKRFTRRLGYGYEAYVRSRRYP